MRPSVALLVVGLLLAGCNQQESAVKPPPVTMTDDALGHTCQMYLADHDGPKGQIAIKGMDQPLWFAQVVDAVAYLQGRERDGDVLAAYVSDMGKAESWGAPGRDNWVDADSASFVIDSRRMGGMGMPEAIPFGTKQEADAFVAEEGGKVVSLTEIPASYVSAPDRLEKMPGMTPN